MFLLALPLAKPVSRIFTQDENVVTHSAYYLWIMIFGMIGLNITNWMSRAFTTIGRPIWTIVLNVVGTLLIVIPLCILGKIVYGYIGILLGICLGQIIVGFGATIIASKKMHP
jgi:Na+-driven multidrug efflux pump